MGSAAEGTAVPTAVPTEGAEGLPPPAPRLEDWPVEDDFMLRESVEAGAALPAIARGILPFSKPYTLEDITNRWRCVRRAPPLGFEPRTLPFAPELALPLALAVPDALRTDACPRAGCLGEIFFFCPSRHSDAPYQGEARLLFPFLLVAMPEDLLRAPRRFT